MGKKKKQPNPAIVNARQEGYNNGFNIGFGQGVVTGRNEATYILAAKFDGLNKVPGIGPKMMDKIVSHFGREYFQEVPDEYKEIIQQTKDS